MGDLKFLSLRFGAEALMESLAAHWPLIIALAALILLILIIVWLDPGIAEAQAEDRTAVTFFGRLLYEAEPGPVFLLKRVMKLKVYPRGVIQFEAPGEPEQVERDDRKKLVGNEVRAIRITHAEMHSAEWLSDDGKTKRTWSQLSEDEKREAESDPLNFRLTSEINFVIRMQIGPTQDDLFKFIRTIKTIDEAKKQIEDTVTVAAQDRLARLTLGHANMRREVITKELLKEVQILVGQIRPSDPEEAQRDPWAVTVHDVDMKPFNTGKSVAEAQASSAAAAFEHQRIVEIGEAKAEAERLLLVARAVGVEALAQKINMPAGQLAAQITAMEEAIKSANYAVLPDMWGVLGGLKQILPQLPGGEAPKK